MSKEELQNLRRELGMTMSDFGEWMAQQINASQPENSVPVKPYNRHRVHNWESGKVAIPAKVELVMARRQIDKQQAMIQELKQGPKQRRRQKQR